MNTNSPATYLVVPCGAGKLDHAAPAAELYTGSLFCYQLAAAQAEAAATGATVLILSALHGLVTLDEVLAPYNLKMGAAGSVTPAEVAAQALALGIDYGVEVYAFLPKAYLTVLDQALRSLDVYAQNVYEAAPGLGFQRGVCRVVLAA